MEEKFQRSYRQPSVKFKKPDNLLLKGGSIYNAEKRQFEKLDIVLAKGKIDKVGVVGEKNFKGKVFDAKGMSIVPGLLDIHVHFREPGREDKETLITGADSAAAGGFTGVCTMPNTDPATDNREIVEFIKDGFSNHLVDVYPIAAITKGRKGEQIVEMAELVDAGVVAFSDDGSAVSNPLVVRRALEYSRMFDTLIIEHCEDKYLAQNGVMHEGFMSSKLGLAGIPSIAEELILARDIMLAKYTSGRLHIAHISTAGAIELVRRAKADGVQVTCEVTPHHFTLTDEAIEGYDTNFKMNPPLRTGEDVKAVIKGLKDGTIDTIATDHAPHTIEDKDVEFDAAPFGVIGLETAIGLAYSELVRKKKLTFINVIEKMSVNPYRILGLPVPQFREGVKANLTVIDTGENWVVDKNDFKSRSRNTPFDGWKLTGRSKAVINKNLFLVN